MAEIGAPPTLNSSFQGTAQAFQQSLGTVPLLILAALVVVYLILGILYESYIHPLTILSTLPSAGVGALAILMAFGYDFSLIALIGIILLIGIVKKNGIMMVDFAITAERDEHLSPEQSIRKAALLRFRPIMMTTMAAMLGGVPLMLGTGTGSEIRQPLGYAMVGGLIVSQALTLFTTPVIYLYLDRLSNAFSGWGRSSKRRRTRRRRARRDQGSRRVKKARRVRRPQRSPVGALPQPSRGLIRVSSRKLRDPAPCPSAATAPLPSSANNANAGRAATQAELRPQRRAAPPAGPRVAAVQAATPRLNA